MSLNGYERLPLDSQRRLDEVCARFERDWAGPSPARLAEPLADAPPDEADVWLTELLHIEVECARRAGAAARAADYRARLPAQGAAIDAVFADCAPAPGPGDLVGKYRLSRPIGRGASGTVFEAEDTVIGRRVAVKLLTGPAAASRTVQEARAVGRLQHPNIVTVHDAGSADGVWYIAMELLDGSAADRLKTNGPFAPGEATQIVADVCRGLTAAHAAGLVHRDIKPANVLLAPAGAGHRPFAKLSDFGLAQTGPDEGDPGAAAGTPLYMAPEQFGGGEVGPACDIYSLGATYCALLTGHPPYRSADATELRRAHATDPSPVVTDRAGAVLPAHTRVVARAMAKAPADRYASAAALLADLESLSARRPTPTRMRRRILVGVTAVAIATLVLTVPGPTNWITSALDRTNSAPPPPANPAWVPLFNGSDLTGWTGNNATVVVDEEPVIRIGGSAPGSLVTAGEYGNYHLRLEVRWAAARPVAGGLRYHVTPPPAGGPDENGWDEFALDAPAFGLHRHTADRSARPAVLRQGRLISPAPDEPLDAPALPDARWHRIDLACWNGVAVHGVDGVVVSTRLRPKSADGPAPVRGRIELRATHGALDVRRIEIRPIAGIPAEFQNRD